MIFSFAYQKLVSELVSVSELGDVAILIGKGQTRNTPL